MEEYQEKIRILYRPNRNLLDFKIQLPYPENKGRGTTERLYTDYGQMNELAGTTYCRLHKPTTKRLYSGQKGLVTHNVHFTAVESKHFLNTRTSHSLLKNRFALNTETNLHATTENFSFFDLKSLKKTKFYFEKIFYRQI